MNKFKLGVLIFFGIFIVIGVGAFASYKGSSSGPKATVVVWGFLPSSTFDSIIRNTALYNNPSITVTYAEKDPDTFDQEFVNSLADGTGPDIVMVREDMFWKHKNRLYPIPYKSYPERTFKDSFVQEGELFLGQDGIYAIPFTIDPLVMYWNRTVFTNASIANPPQYWDEFLSLTQSLSKKDSIGTVSQSLVALGEWKNIKNAKDIISLLMLQAGTPITTPYNGSIRSTLLDGYEGSTVSPGISAVNFYTQFANPTGPSYSWNRSLPDSLTYFLSGKSALYFGFASELPVISQKNPNLNFDVTGVPQARQATARTTMGHVYGLALVKQSKVIQAGFTVVTTLTNPDTLNIVGMYTNLPPVRRSMLATKPTDAYKSVFYDGALISRGWIDPDRQSTSLSMQNMIESITSGRARLSDALNRANDEFTVLIK